MQHKTLRVLLTLLLTLCLHYYSFGADPIPRPVTVCSGANIIIRGDLLTLASSSYVWEFNQGNTWISAPGVNSEENYLVSSLYNPSTVNIAYTLRRKTVIMGLLVYDSYYYVTVQPIIPITNNVIDLPLTHVFCGSGTPDTIIGSIPSSGAASFTYQWQNSDDNLTFTNINGAYAKNYKPERITANTYLRRIAISDGCGLSTISNSIKLTVLPVLADNVINPPVATLFCASGDPEVLTGNTPSGSTGLYVYQWQKSTDNIIFTTIAGANGPNYDPPMLGATTYLRRLVAAEPCNIPLVSNVVTIRVIPELLAPELEKVSINICAGATSTLSVKNPIIGLTYSWYDSAAKTKLLFVGQSYVTDVLTASKTFYVASSNNTCSSGSLGVVQVNVVALPNANVLGDNNTASICSGATATFKVASPIADVVYNWYAVAKGGSPIGSGFSWTTPSLTVSTTFYLEIVNKEGCAATNRQALVVTVMPKLQTALVAVEQTTAHSIVFKWAPVSGAIGYKVSTDGGLTFNNPSSGSNGLTHTVDGLAGSESVTILVKAIGVLDCQESTFSRPTTGETIKVFDGIFVPNAFTPNGDGKNDVAYVRSETIKTLSFYIYSQFGKQLFFSTNIGNGWDGTYKGANQPVGVYVYTVNAIMGDGSKVNKKGTITLIR